MQCKYTTAIPFEDLKQIIRNEKSDELWIVFAYYSSKLVKDLFEVIQKRKHIPRTHIVFSASSVNPLQDIVDDLFQLADFFQDKGRLFDFDLVEEPLMHAKVIAVKTGDDVTLYIGSGNLTHRAISDNIEAGVILHPDTSDAALNFIRNLMKKCKSPNWVDTLKVRSVFSHFRKELLFLALEQSKLHQSVQLRPTTLQGIFSNPDEIEQVDTVDAIAFADAIHTVQVINRNSVRISILKQVDRSELFESEGLLRTGITKNLAIRLDGYGWVSSLWSLKQAESKDNPVNLALQRFLNDVNSVRSKYKKKRYREEMASEIRNGLQQEADNSAMSLSDSQDEKIEAYLERFSLDYDDKRSPYRSLERLYWQVTSGREGAILSLLSPYRIGGDENSDTNVDFLLPDQLNLLVMCKLAVKLRLPHTKSPKAPAVWWFDYALALDDNVCTTFGYKSDSEFKDKTKGQLEKIVADILEQSDSLNLKECLEVFCQVTGFNLALKYPQTNEAFVTKDTKRSEIEEIYPYVFVESRKKRYNFKMFLPAFDVEHRPSEISEAEAVLKRMSGEFVLGRNMFFWFDAQTGKTYLCIKKL